MRACGQESRNPTRVQDGKRQRQPIAGKENYTKEFSWFGNYGVTPIKSFQMVNMAEFCNARQRPCKLEKTIAFHTACLLRCKDTGGSKMMLDARVL